MLSSLLRPPVASRRRASSRSPFTFPSPENTRKNAPTERSKLLPHRRTHQSTGGSLSSGDDEEDLANPHEDAEAPLSDNEDGVIDDTPLLPLFSAAHLDALPIYTLTHAIRLLVISKCETTLTWDQLRSPQVSQFLLKPIQQEMQASHFSRATEYALMANCLQFHKEISLNPGNSGTSKTRAMVCELLAIKLLKEYSTRELIDALSYDFDPLQGQSDLEANAAVSRAEWTARSKSKTPLRSTRISCFEIAIRAQAKRFLAHPLVVQQLEAIWAGSIVFHATADSLHRPKGVAHHPTHRSHGTGDQRHVSNSFTHPNGVLRRSVTLYNPRDASLFKLSRLRVPRYRYFLSTLSYAILLGLFLAVLVQKPLEINPLEIVFWFWCAGYILDEIVGFNEQGFSLYLASFWNTFDLGILLLLIGHLCLRLYGIIMPETRKHPVANLAYDVLAANAVLLFPRLFSVLDHYRYFSQLLIAFRMMASDLVAIFVLILVSCSGFFVALTLSFGNETLDSPASVAYALFQMLMGYTPAAWDRWDGYNILGKLILMLFLFICHFLVVTILITVLTNSFMAIVQNANEEHQFVFAVNTISMVKSDALFSYIAPTNIIAWLITPLRFFVPLRRFVKINRTMIKMTHFPVLFSIFLYEKSILRPSVVDPAEVVEPRGRSSGQIPAKAAGLSLFSPQHQRQVREASVATWQKDRALDAVFRRPFGATLRDGSKSQTRAVASNTVNRWMQNLGEDGVLSPPQEQDRGVVDRLESRRSLHGRPQFIRKRRDFTDITRSVASDPEDFGDFTDITPPPPPLPPPPPPPQVLAFPASRTPPPQDPVPEPVQSTDADGDDELVSSDNEDGELAVGKDNSTSPGVEAPLRTAKPGDYFSVHSPKHKIMDASADSGPSRAKRHAKKADDRNARGEMAERAMKTQRPRPHLRTVSSATIIYNPVIRNPEGHLSVPDEKRAPEKAPRSVGIRTPKSGAMSPALKSLSNTPGRRTPNRAIPGASRARAILPPKNDPTYMSAPSLVGMVRMGNRDAKPRRSSLTMDLGSDLGDNQAMGGGFVGGFPASLTTQMAYATGALRQEAAPTEDREMLGRLVLARMNKLEEGMKEVIHEMRENRMTGTNNSPNRSRERPGRLPRLTTRRARPKDKERRNSDKEIGRSQQEKRKSVNVAEIAMKGPGKGDEWEDEEVGVGVAGPIKSGSV